MSVHQETRDRVGDGNDTLGQHRGKLWFVLWVDQYRVTAGDLQQVAQRPLTGLGAMPDIATYIRQLDDTGPYQVDHAMRTAQRTDRTDSTSRAHEPFDHPLQQTLAGTRRTDQEDQSL